MNITCSLLLEVADRGAAHHRHGPLVVEGETEEVNHPGDGRP